jgi:uncharacterized protein HemY
MCDGVNLIYSIVWMNHVCYGNRRINFIVFAIIIILNIFFFLLSLFLFFFFFQQFGKTRVFKRHYKIRKQHKNWKSITKKMEGDRKFLVTLGLIIFIY